MVIFKAKHRECKKHIPEIGSVVHCRDGKYRGFCVNCKSTFEVKAVEKDVELDIDNAVHIVQRQIRTPYYARSFTILVVSVVVFGMAHGQEMNQSSVMNESFESSSSISLQQSSVGGIIKDPSFAFFVKKNADFSVFDGDFNVQVQLQSLLDTVISLFNNGDKEDLPQKEVDYMNMLMQHNQSFMGNFNACFAPQL